MSGKARGQGIASAMCKHSQQEAMNRGFLSMQYNVVAATSEGAVRLWKKHGFQVVGTLPNAFRHPQLGFAGALVMFKELGLMHPSDHSHSDGKKIRYFNQLSLE